MNRQPRDISTEVSQKQHFRRLRFRMIRETEVFLNNRLSRNGTGWAADEATVARFDPQINGHDRRQRPPHDESAIDVRTRPDAGTLVQIRPNQHGVVDDLGLRALEIELRSLTGDHTAGDIVIGMERVAVMTAGFMSLLAIIRPRLICQRRRISLAGVRPECAASAPRIGPRGVAGGVTRRQPRASISKKRPQLRIDETLCL